MSSRRWYDAQGGLRFTCTQCGKCCSRPGYILVHASEAPPLAARYKDGARPEDLDELWVWDDAVEGWLIEVEEGESCPFLVDEQCSVHDIKPRQCATYPFWEEVTMHRFTWAQEASLCEGIQPDGELYTPELIQLIENEERLTFESKDEG